MWNEFRQFIARGNVLDLAVAVVIGAAFGKIVTSLVDGIIMPPIGLILGYQGSLNVAVAEHWVVRMFGGYTQERPGFEAWYAGGSVEWEKR